MYNLSFYQYPLHSKAHITFKLPWKLPPTTVGSSAGTAYLERDLGQNPLQLVAEV